MRRQHRVLGRGSLEFIHGPNRKILAFLRRDDRETILVVANLSRTVQPVSLDLQAFEGLIPIEMAGADGIPADWQAAVFPDARSVRVLLVHAPARSGQDHAGDRRTRRFKRRYRGAPAAADGRRLEQCHRQRHTRRDRTARADAFPPATAMVHARVAHHSKVMLQRLGARTGSAPSRRFSRSSRSITPTGGRRPIACRCRSSRANGSIACCNSRRAACSRASPARGRARSLTASRMTSSASASWGWSAGRRKSRA